MVMIRRWPFSGYDVVESKMKDEGWSFLVLLDQMIDVIVVCGLNCSRRVPWGLVEMIWS